MGKTNQLQTTSLQQTFTFEGTIDVQVVILEDNPWFVASDVCHVLGLQNPTERLKTTLESDEFLPYVVHRAGQQRTVNVVNESGLYALIFQSRKPIAKKFRKWVTSEVLSAIGSDGRLVGWHNIAGAGGIRLNRCCATVDVIGIFAR